MTKSTGLLLLPNLGAEEGDDFFAVARLPAARVSARLWSLGYRPETRLLMPPGEGSTTTIADWVETRVSDHWPTSLGSLPEAGAYGWLDETDGIRPWLRTAPLDALDRVTTADPLLGSAPAIVEIVSDKAFALDAARSRGVLDRTLDGLLMAFDPAGLSDATGFFDAVDAETRSWPDWTQRRFTLKPRFGTSGRGRVAGAGDIDRSRVVRDLERFKRRGGLLLEPWFERLQDISVAFQIENEECAGPDAPPIVRLIGSMTMLTTPAGGYRGHCGELDARGRVFSGHDQDENLRADAAAVASAAAEAGFRGSCGVDAFTYRVDEGECLRPGVEINARPTMGTVVMALIRRAWPMLRERQRVEPGERHAFLFALLAPDQADAIGTLQRGAQLELAPLRLVEVEEPGGPLPVLFFGRNLESLRTAYAAATNC